ncbi:hypothetical protein LB503_004623 [Fusarium chuoi]|nr:hypothetical protein LB503_004623 [Fusarium chuoi]
MPQEEKESSGLKESDEPCTQRHANNCGDGSGLPLRPGMGPPKTEGEPQNLDKDGQASSECVDSLSPEEFSAQSPGFNKLRQEYLDCLWEEGSLKEDEEEMPRYASYYGDGSGLPLRPGMGPPMTEEESQESWKKLDEQLEILSNMNDEEFHAQHPEHNAIKDFCLTEEEAEKLLEGDDDEQPRYAHSYGDGSGLPLRPGMGPPKTKEEQEESLKKWEAEDDKIFNMSEEEFNAEFPGYSKFTRSLPSN